MNQDAFLSRKYAESNPMMQGSTTQNQSISPLKRGLGGAGERIVTSHRKFGDGVPSGIM